MKQFRLNFWVALFLMGTCILPSQVFARDRWDHGRYHDDDWHDRGWFWFGAGVAALTVGTIVSSLPPYYEIVYVNNVPYYYCDGVYYRSCHMGYEVVERPHVVVVSSTPTVILEHPSVAQVKKDSSKGEYITINVPNKDGSYTNVDLIKKGNGYVGPQGEYYEGNPTVEQLKALYGK